MNRTRLTLLVLGGSMAALLLLGAAGGLLVRQGLWVAVPLLMVPCLFYGWMFFAFLNYRRARQEEFLHLLTTAVESGAPLAPALRAYVQDRPHGPTREFWLAGLFLFVLPGYYWIWHRRRSFDQRVESVARLLDQGLPLHYALQLSPGVASRETVLAVAIGETTGKLALCLRATARPQLTSISFELVPRLLYPLLVLYVLIGIMGFWNVYLLPKLDKIYRDLDGELPEMTLSLAGMWNYLLSGAGALFVWLAAMALLLTFSSTLRWYTPLIGRIYRMHIRGKVLRMLGILLQTDMPAPQALAVLADSGYFAGEPERRLEGSRHLVQQGEPLANSLYQRGLLSRAMLPLVQGAERARNLPWALAELGENLSGRSVRSLRRISQASFPIVVFLIGLVVGFMVIGMFVPLVNIIGRLSG